MKLLKCVPLVVLFLMQPCLAFASAAEAEKPQALARMAGKLAAEAVARLEKEIGGLGGASGARLTAVSDKAEKSIQEKLTEEHQKAKDGKYDDKFHEAIKNNGGKRLKEEWEKNCKSRVMKGTPGSADLAEINCY